MKDEPMILADEVKIDNSTRPPNRRMNPMLAAVLGGGLAVVAPILYNIWKGPPTPDVPPPAVVKKAFTDKSSTIRFIDDLPK